LAELSIKRALFGYHRRDVDALISARDAELELRASELRMHCSRIQELEAVADRLTLQVVEREREVRDVREELRQASTAVAPVMGPDGSLRLIEALGRRVEELHAQARGQATRIRLAGLRDAAELTSRLQAAVASREGGRKTAVEVPIRRVAPRMGAPAGGAAEIGEPLVPAVGGPETNGAGAMLAGAVQMDVGPLADFSQLIRIEDAVKRIDSATDISIKRFSGGRATLAMHFNEPVELLRELEERSDLEFKVRRASADELVLDVAGAAATQ
jgi:propanediol dehydratase small subunit